jgi:hypothetical protein
VTPFKTLEKLILMKHSLVQVGNAGTEIEKKAFYYMNLLANKFRFSTWVTHFDTLPEYELYGDL